jgi:hypothetical protein
MVNKQKKGKGSLSSGYLTLDQTESPHWASLMPLLRAMEEDFASLGNEFGELVRDAKQSVLNAGSGGSHALDDNERLGYWRDHRRIGHEALELLDEIDDAMRMLALRAKQVL